MVVLEFLGLLAVTVIAAYLLSRGAERMTEKWGRNIVGSIILALVTTLPEYAFVFWASMKGEYRMAVGSAIGACTLLITLGYGLVIVLATSRLSRRRVERIILSRATRVDALYLLVTGLVALFFIWGDGTLVLWEGIVLTALFGGYVYHVIRSGAAHHTPSHEVTRKVMTVAWIELVVGGAIVFVCSEPFVDSMIGIAQMFHVSPVVIAIILGPLASEMPEKLTAYITVLRDGRNAELSVCNFLGSKVNHNSLLLAVMPFVACFKGEGPVGNIMSGTFLLMTALTVAVSALLARGRLERWQGMVLIACYVAAMALATRSH